MSAPWNGLPDQPERTGWHWLKHSNGNYPQPFEWNPDTRQWEVDIDDEGFPEEMADSGYQYICRCPDPFELAQMRQDERDRCQITVGKQLIKIDLGQVRDAFNMGIRCAVAAIRILPDEEGKKS